MPYQVKDEPSAYDTIRLFDRVQATFHLPPMPVITADSIATMIDQLPEMADDDGYDTSFYGIVAPPFKKFFVEAMTYNDAGWYIVGGKPTYLPAATVIRGAACYDVYGLGWDHIVTPEAARHIPATMHWTLALFGFMWSTLTPAHVIPFQLPVFIFLDRDGRIIGNKQFVYVNQFVGNDRRIVLPLDAANEPIRSYQPMPALGLANYVPFVFKAIGAMHQRCEAEKVTPSRPAARRAARERIKLNSYYVLHVKPTPVRTVGDFKRIGTPEKRGTREHQVRGHFRYYSPDKPLFGRYSGSFWIPDHRRGDDSYGAIKKDYDVEE